MLKTTVIGHVGRDAEVKTVNGTDVASFSVAHTEKWKNQNGEPQERTVWLNCNTWKPTKVVEFLKKGTQVYMEGSPSTSTYKNKQGEVVSTLDLRVDFVQLLGSAKQETNPEPQPAGTGTDGAQDGLPV